MTLMDFAPVDVPTLEATELHGLVKVDIDQVIDYVHSAGTAKLPGYLELYSRYLRRRWNVDELDSTQDAEDRKQMPADAKGSFPTWPPASTPANARSRWSWPHCSSASPRTTRSS